MNMGYAQSFEQVNSQNLNLAAGATQTFTFNLQNLRKDRSYGALALMLRGTLTAGAGAVDVPPEVLDGLITRIQLNYHGGASTINISGENISKYLNLTHYDRRNRVSELLTVGNDTNFRHVVPIPLTGTYAQAVLNRRCRIPGGVLHPNALQVTVSTAGWGTIVGALTGEIRVMADGLPIVGDDATVAAPMQLMETTDIQGSVRDFPNADVIILSRVPIVTQQLPAPLASGITTFTIDGIVDSPLEPQEFIQLSQYGFAQTFRYNEARLGYMDASLGVHRRIDGAGAIQSVGVFKPFDRRDFKGTLSNPTLRFPSRNPAIALEVIAEASSLSK
jgi:hypothetical protein